MKFVYRAIIFSSAILATLVLIGCSASPSTPSLTAVQPSSSLAITLHTPESATTPSPTMITPTVSNPSPSSSPTSTPFPIPTAIYTPAATPFNPTSPQLNLMQYMLGLINKDRQSAGVSPVTLSFNAAAQNHAQNMLENKYSAHWDTDGLKPYMRYTLEGGLNFDDENVAYSTGSNSVDVKTALQNFEHAMMYDDAASNWSHRDAIISKWQKKVNIGIAYDSKSVALDEEFEGDYLEYFQPPTLTGNTLSLSGRFKLGNIQGNVDLNNVTITFDDLPQPIPASDLMNDSQYHHYSLGPQIGLILPPPPPGQVYSNFPANGVIAKQWNTDQSGQFSIRADISPILSKGPGVYTIVLVTIIGNDHYNMTNYSIFVK